MAEIDGGTGLQEFTRPLNIAERAGNWCGLWRVLGVAPPEGLHRELEAAWSESGRRYHDLRHLGECLALLQQCERQARRPAEIALALWFHDAIYQPAARDNEARSADWAASCLNRAGGPGDLVRRVHALVMATRHGLTDLPCGDAALLADIDLAILGSPPPRFEAYERDVRQEYAEVPDAIYDRERARILQAFLARPHIYRTPALACRFEAAARSNLRWALDRLGAGSGAGDNERSVEP